MTTVSKIEVVSLNEYGPKGERFGVFVHAIRNGKKIKTCIETGTAQDMNDRAKKHAKKFDVLPVLA